MPSNSPERAASVPEAVTPAPVAPRHVNRQEFYLQMLGLFKGSVPNGKLFDEGMSMFDNADVIEKNKLRRHATSPHIAAMVDELAAQSRVIIEHDPKIKRNWNVIDTAEELAMHVMVGSKHEWEDIEARGAPTYVHKSLLTKKNLLLFVRDVVERDKTLKEHVAAIAKDKQWDIDFCERFLARAILAALHSEPVRTNRSYIAYDVIENACREGIVELRGFYEMNDEYLVLGIDNILRLRSRMTLESKRSNVYALQTEKDREFIKELNAIHPDVRAERATTQMRTNADALRTEVIPRLVAEDVPLRKAFWEIHTALFAGDPYFSHMHDVGSVGTVPQYVKNVGGAAFYKRSVGKTRHNSVGSNWTSHVEPNFLPHLEKNFFKELTKAIKNITSEDEFLDLITKVDMFLITAHLPFDGCGRSTEEFIVFLGEKLGYPLTVSQNGYRDQLSETVEVRMKGESAYKNDRDVICLRNLGIEPDMSKALKTGWREHMDELLRKKFGGRKEGWKHFEMEQALQAARITDQINDPKGTRRMTEMYKTFSTQRSIWDLATVQTYVAAQDPVAAQACDKIVSQYTNNYTPHTRKMLEALEEDFPTDPLVDELVHEILRPVSTKGMLKLARMWKAAGEDTRAIEMYSALLSLDPQNAEYLNEIAGLVAKTDAAQAENFYRKAIAAHPDFALSYGNLAMLLNEKGGKEKEVEQLFEEALICNPFNIEIRKHFGQFYLKRNDARAVLLCEDYLVHNPEDTNFRIELVNFFVKNDRKNPRLEQHLDLVIERQPTNVTALFQLGCYYDGINKLQKASLYYFRMQQIDPKNPDARVKIGMLQRMEGNYDESETVLRHVLQEFPTHVAAYLELALTLRCKNDAPGVRKVLEAYLGNGLDPDHSGFCQLMNELTEAEKEAEEATKK
jgi:tetratricopeptide (TPR) repeat protein